MDRVMNYASTAILIVVLVTVSGCSLTSSSPGSDFFGKIGNDLFTGDTQVDNTGPNSLLIRGYEEGDKTNGKFFTIILDDYDGPGTYKTQQYSYAQLVGGDAIVPIARAEMFEGAVKINKAQGELVSGKFSGKLIVRETEKKITADISFKVRKVATNQN